MKNKFNTPIVFFDLETTGTSPVKDKIVSISVKKILPDQTETTASSLINPEVEIPKEASDVHGITNEMVKDAPLFKQLAKSIYTMMNGAAIIGFNSNQFDVIILAEAFVRVGIVWPSNDTKLIDVCTIFKKHEERTLTAAMKFYCDKAHDGAHEAAADVEATVLVFEAQMQRYDDIKDMSIEELHEFCVFDKARVDLAGKIARNEQGEYIYNFGKYLGQNKLVKDDLKYAEWMLKPESEFTRQTKMIVQNIVNQATGKTMTLNLI